MRKRLGSRLLLLLGLHFDDFRCRLHALNVILIFGNELPPVNDLLPIPCMRNEHFFSQQFSWITDGIVRYQTQHFPNPVMTQDFDNFTLKISFFNKSRVFFKDQQSTTSYPELHSKNFVMHSIFFEIMLKISWNGKNYLGWKMDFKIKKNLWTLIREPSEKYFEFEF